MPALLAAFAGWLGPILFSVSGVVTTALVTVALIVLEQLTGIVSASALWVVDGVLDVLVGILVWLVEQLPLMPASPPSNLQAAADMLGFTNRYLPISEVLALLPLYAAVLGGLFIYKGVKLVRGGG